MRGRPSIEIAKPYDLDLISLRTEDNLQLDGLLYTPKIWASAAILLVHGRTCNFLIGPPRFVPLPFAREGIASLALNMRSNSLGYSRNDIKFENFDEFEFNMAGAAWENFELGYKDVKAAIACLHELGYEKIILAGHSAGGFYCGDYAGRYQDVDGLILLSPLTAHSFGALGAWFKSEDEAEAVKKQAAELVASGNGHKILPVPTWYYAVSAGTMLARFNEPSDRWTKVVSTNKKPTLLLYGSREDRAQHWQEIFETVITAEKKEILGIEGAEHMYIGYEDKFVQAMLSFIRHSVL